MKPKLSAAIITLNEERNLPRCLESIGWVDEIVVVDSGSSDSTVQIAEKYGARVYHNPWPGYGKQWEKAIQLCSHPWIMLLAADNVVERGLAGEILEVLANPGENRGFVIQQKNYFLGKWMRYCGWYPAPVLQLFRKDSVRVIQREVHELFTVSPYIVRPLTKGHVDHYSYHSIRQYLEKFNRYTDLEAVEKLKNNADISGKDLLPAAFRKFYEMYLLKEGFRDGLHGLLLCTLSALYEFVAIAKCLELKGEFKQPGDSK